MCLGRSPYQRAAYIHQSRHTRQTLLMTTTTTTTTILFTLFLSDLRGGDDDEFLHHFRFMGSQPATASYNLTRLKRRRRRKTRKNRTSIQSNLHLIRLLLLLLLLILAINKWNQKLTKPSQVKSNEAISSSTEKRRWWGMTSSCSQFEWCSREAVQQYQTTPTARLDRLTQSHELLYCDGYCRRSNIFN